MKTPSMVQALLVTCSCGMLALSASVPAAEPPDIKHNRKVIDKAFADWAAERGSFYDLLVDDATVTIEGQSPHSGTFSKAAFLSDRAKPFQARFTTAILPTKWTIWEVDDEVIVRWESQATDCQGRPYTNSYAYFIDMKNGRVLSLTMFLDMGAFDDVWNRCQPISQVTRSKK